MIALDNGDAIRGVASAAGKVDYTLHGVVGTTVTQLADGQLGDTEADLYAAGADGIVVMAIILVNIDTSTRTVNLYLKPSGGTSRRIIPKDVSLPAGYSLHTDGVKVNVLDVNGRIITYYAAHASTHEDGGADEVALAASQITSERFGMARMPDGDAGKVLIAQGVGSNPAYGDPIPKAEDESGSFSYTTGYGTTETDISALFTTALTGATRRKYSVWLDIYNMQQDTAAWTKLTVRVKAKVDGTNYRTVDNKDIAKTDNPGVMVEVPAVAQDVQITFQLDVALNANQTVYYHYVKEFLE